MYLIRILSIQRIIYKTNNPNEKSQGRHTNCNKPMKRCSTPLAIRETQIKSAMRDNFTLSAAAAKSLQSCPTLSDPIDSIPPGSPVPGILQARTRVGCHFLLQCVKVKSLSRVRLLATPWTAAPQAPPSMGFSRLEYWSGVPLPSHSL